MGSHHPKYGAHPQLVRKLSWVGIDFSRGTKNKHVRLIILLEELSVMVPKSWTVQEQLLLYKHYNNLLGRHCYNPWCRRWVYKIHQNNCRSRLKTLKKAKESKRITCSMTQREKWNRWIWWQSCGWRKRHGILSKENFSNCLIPSIFRKTICNFQWKQPSRPWILANHFSQKGWPMR